MYINISKVIDSVDELLLTNLAPWAESWKSG